jgi:hypothetical protein
VVDDFLIVGQLPAGGVLEHVLWLELSDRFAELVAQVEHLRHRATEDIAIGPEKQVADCCFG